MQAELATFQTVLGGEPLALEIYHVIAKLLVFCQAYAYAAKDGKRRKEDLSAVVGSLQNGVIVLIGHLTLQNSPSHISTKFRPESVKPVN